MNDKTQELSIAGLIARIDAFQSQLSGMALKIEDYDMRLAAKVEALNALEDKLAAIKPVSEMTSEQMVELIAKLGEPIKERIDQLEQKVDEKSGEAPGPYTSISKLKTPAKKPSAYIKRQ